jgi:hypothetical protein
LPGPSAPLAAPSAAPSSGTPFVPGQADLQAALLTAADLPGSGYTTQQAVSGAGLGSLKDCPALSAGESGISAQATESFSASTASPATEISEGLFQDTVSGAEQMVGAFSTVASTCGSFSTTISTSGGPLTLAITVTAEPFPSIGDETAADSVNVYIAAANVTITADVVAIRHGGTVIEITNVDYPPVSGLTQAVAAAAYKKVAARW